MGLFLFLFLFCLRDGTLPWCRFNTLWAHTGLRARSAVFLPGLGDIYGGTRGLGLEAF